jgi:hypothetical protein
VSAREGSAAAAAGSRVRREWGNEEMRSKPQGEGAIEIDGWPGFMGLLGFGPVVHWERETDAHCYYFIF